MTAAAALAAELTDLLRLATQARAELAQGALLQLDAFEARIAQLCAALREQPEASGLRPLLGSLHDELSALAEAIETQRAALEQPGKGPGGA